MQVLTGFRKPWIGGNRAADADPVAGPWTWSDGSPWTYENWKPNSPDNDGGLQMKVFMEKSGVWNDGSPGGVRSFVCEYKL